MTIQELKTKNLILFEVISGSKSFGLNTPTSDTDIKGVYYLPKEAFFGLEYIPQISNETNDEVYYEIGRFIELLLKNNPNILEILATPEDCILYKHPIMNLLQIEDFLSKLSKDSFAGYAITQIKKARGLKKKIVNPIPKERKSLLDFCYVFGVNNEESISLEKWLNKQDYKQENCGLMKVSNAKGIFALFYDKNKNLGYKGIIKNKASNEVSLSSVPKEEKQIAYLSCNLEGYSMYCKEYAEYWDWIAKRNEDRYNTNQKHGKQYDSKNMMHTIRLLQSAKQIITTGKLNIRVTNREELLAIKAGAMDYDDLLEIADHLIETIEMEYEKCNLPEMPIKEKAIANLIKIREKMYQ